MVFEDWRLRMIDWIHDPAFHAQVADEATGILGLTPGSRAFVAGVVQDPEHFSGERDLSPGELVQLADFAEEILPAVRRQGFTPDRYGYTDELARTYVNALRTGTDPQEEPTPPPMPDHLHADDIEAAVAFIGKFSKATRRRVFKTSNMLVIGTLVRQLLRRAELNPDADTATTAPVLLAEAPTATPVQGRAGGVSASPTAPLAVPTIAPLPEHSDRGQRLLVTWGVPVVVFVVVVMVMKLFGWL